MKVGSVIMELKDFETQLNRINDSTEQKTKPTHSPHLHRRLRRSTAGLHVPQISSPLSALQDLATNRAFIATDPSLQDPDVRRNA
nr:hypothetical protein CFP56_14697 [Quercus suber]